MGQQLETICYRYSSFSCNRLIKFIENLSSERFFFCFGVNKINGVMTLKKVIAVIMIVVFATLLLPLAIVYLMGAGGDTVQDKIEGAAVSVYNADGETTEQ